MAEYARVGQLLSDAATTPADMFILLLNNMQFSDTTSFNGTKHCRSLEVVSHLKTTYDKPVIALAEPWRGQFSRAEQQAKQAGATFFLFDPSRSITVH
jgi:hypothetical protein